MSPGTHHHSRPPRSHEAVPPFHEFHWAHPAGSWPDGAHPFRALLRLTKGGGAMLCLLKGYCMRGYMDICGRQTRLFRLTVPFSFWFPASAHAGGGEVSCIGVWGVGETASRRSRRQGKGRGSNNCIYTTVSVLRRAGPLTFRDTSHRGEAQIHWFYLIQFQFCLVHTL